MTLTLPGAPPPTPDTIERALSLTQPWAGLVATGIKTIENWPWTLPKGMVGRRFAIHASRQVDDEVVKRLEAMGIDRHPSWFTKGHLIGVARVVGCVKSEIDLVVEIGRGLVRQDQTRFWMGPFAFLLGEIRLLPEPIECKGALGFWGLSESLANKVACQLREDV